MKPTSKTACSASSQITGGWGVGVGWKGGGGGVEGRWGYTHSSCPLKSSKPTLQSLK